MVDEQTIIALLGRNDVFRYGSDFDFSKPAAFVQAKNEKMNSFASKLTVEITVLFDTDETFSDFEESFDGIFKPRTFLNNTYIYHSVKDTDGEELLPNGFHSRKITYVMTIEEVQ